MADTKISALTERTALASTDDMPVAAGGASYRFRPNTFAAYLATATLAAGTLTTSQPMTLTQTWNAAGVTFTGFKVNITDTASAAASLLADWQVAGVSQFSVRKDGVVSAISGFYASAGSFWVRSDDSTHGLKFGTGLDVVVVRDAANTLALRNSTTAQTFNVYNTWTDASNYERLGVIWSSNFAYLDVQKAGTGTSRALIIGATGIYLRGATSAANGWQITSSNHLLAETDNAFDIGASGATRPRNVYAGASFIAANGLGRGVTPSAAAGWVVIAASGIGDVNFHSEGGLTTGSYYRAANGGTIYFNVLSTGIDLNAPVGLGGVSATSSHGNIAAGTTAKSQLRFIQGVAPTSPVDGDMWREDNTNTGLKIRINGVTKTVTVG